MPEQPLFIAEGSHIDHFGNMVMVNYVDLRDSPSRSPIPLLVKGCRAKDAIENGASVRISPPSAFRDEGGNLIRDPGEGYHYEGSAKAEIRTVVDEPDALARAREEDKLVNHVAELAGLKFKQTTNSTSRTTTHSSSQETTFDWTPPGWLFCTSIEPATDDEWEKWWASMDADYDHVSRIYRPREFARALGSMAVEQLGPRGDMVPHKSTLVGWPTVETYHPTQMIFHGPVVYSDDAMDYLRSARTELDFTLRALFVKGRTHEDQREYRFLVLSKPGHDAVAEYLTASPALLDAMAPHWANLGSPVIRMPEQTGQTEQFEDEHSAPWQNPLVAAEFEADFDNMMREHARAQVRAGNIVSSPHDWTNEEPPEDLEMRTATYAGVEALRNLVFLLTESDDWTPERGRDILAAVWFAEQDIRSLCSALDDPISGISYEDGHIVIRIRTNERPDIELFMAVDQWGKTAIAVGNERKSSISLLPSPYFRADVGQEVKDLISGLEEHLTRP